MKRSCTLLGCAALSFTLVACGGDDTTPSDETTPTPPENKEEVVTPDVTAPTVVSISPADGATGVRSDANVVIQFSEPMDQASVQNSVATADLGAVSFEWSNGGSTVTIKPAAPLEYATGAGNDPGAVTAKQYTVTVGTAAKDVAGNALPGGAQTIFKTLKQMSSNYGRKNELTGTAWKSGSVGDDDDFLQIGDTFEMLGYRSFITIDLTTLPSTAVDITSATLKAAVMSEAIGTPYASLGSGKGILLEHASFAAVDGTAYGLTPLASLGEFAKTGDTAPSLDVTSAVKGDLANRAARSNLSQYRLRFTLEHDGDAGNDQVYIGRDEIALDVTYLAP